MKLIPKEPTGEDQVSYKLLNFKSTHPAAAAAISVEKKSKYRHMRAEASDKNRGDEICSVKSSKDDPPSHTCWVLKLWEGYRIWFFLFGFGWRYSSFRFLYSLIYLIHSPSSFWIFFREGIKYTQNLYIYFFGPRLASSRMICFLVKFTLFRLFLDIHIHFHKSNRKIRSGCVPPDAALCCCDCRKIKDNKNTSRENRGPERLSMFLSELHF